MRSLSVKRRRGFVLVMVLLVISLAAISLASLARNSMLLASEYAEAQDELQRRWGLISCRRTILDRADEIFERLAEEHKLQELPLPEPAIAAGSFEMGGDTYNILLADEDAKINLNVLNQRQPGAIYQATARAQINVRSVAALAEQPLRSWGQLFDLSDRNLRGSVPALLQEATLHVTLWGSGKLNLRRASEESIQLLGQVALLNTQVGKLLALRQEEGWDDTERLIGQLGLKRKERGALRRLVSDKSACYSLWIDIETPQRTWSQLTIVKPGGGDRYLTFTW